MTIISGNGESYAYFCLLWMWFILRLTMNLFEQSCWFCKSIAWDWQCWLNKFLMVNITPSLIDIDFRRTVNRVWKFVFWFSLDVQVEFSKFQLLDSVCSPPCVWFEPMTHLAALPFISTYSLFRRIVDTWNCDVEILGVHNHMWL